MGHCFLLGLKKTSYPPGDCCFYTTLSLKQLTFFFSPSKGKILHIRHPHQRQFLSTVSVFCLSYLVHWFYGWQAGPTGSAPQKTALKFYGPLEGLVKAQKRNPPLQMVVMQINLSLRSITKQPENKTSNLMKQAKDQLCKIMHRVTVLLHCQIPLVPSSLVILIHK